MKDIMFESNNTFFKTILTLFFIVSTSLFAQQDPQITHNMFNKFMYNPGVAGAYPELHATLLHRSQWVGIDGAPTTSNLNAHAYVDVLHGGVGLNVLNDRAANLSMKTVSLSYSYQLGLGPEHQLGMGLSLGLMNYGYDGPWITPDGTNDSALPNPGSSKSVPDFGLGFYFTSGDYYVGLSATHIIPMEVDFDGKSIHDQARHYYFLAGYDYDITDEFSLRGNLFAKTDGVALQTDININTFWKENYWTGLSFRYEDALCFLVGFEVANNLSFAYAFDLVSSKLSTQTSGSHEVMLRYSFELDIIGRGDTRYSSVRFL
jgi:type IX secretion system PorP/SprF family membrane protein